MSDHARKLDLLRRCIVRSLQTAATHRRLAATWPPHSPRHGQEIARADGWEAEAATYRAAVHRILEQEHAHA
jgi:hypothetical protein